MQYLPVVLALLIFFLPPVRAERIQGNVVYLGIALDQEGAAGGWAQVGGNAQWKETIAGTIHDGKLYTAETNGGLYLTDLATGAWQQIGKSEFANTRFMVSITSMLWSVATLAFSKVMAISYWAGETSLCRVLTGTPSL